MTREEAIKILRYNSNVIHQTINGETDPKEVEALDMAIKALEHESDWVPVSERLPKENIPVLLTVEGPEFFGKARREVILASYQRLYKDNYSWLTYEDEPSIIIDLPIAWMSLPKPKPYETQESEDKEWLNISH